MIVKVVRHTAVGIASDICYGQSDVALASTAFADISAVKAKLEYKNEIIYSSPLKRCKLLAEALSSDIRYDDRLKEINMGDWEMKKLSELDETSYKNWLANLGTYRPPRAETYTDVQTRVVDFFKEKIESGTQDTIIVAHDGVIRSLITRILRTNLDNSLYLKLNYGCVLKLLFEDNRWQFWELH
jgi:alpha-ribazole phosphatase